MTTELGLRSPRARIAESRLTDAARSATERSRTSEEARCHAATRHEPPRKRRDDSVHCA